MDQNEWLADRFEEQRAHLRAVAYRMLGSLTEADNAVQDTWLRLSRAGANEVENLGGWLTVSFKPALPAIWLLFVSFVWSQQLGLARATDDLSHRWRESGNRRVREDGQDPKSDDR